MAKTGGVMPHRVIFTFLTLLILIAALPINSALTGRRIRAVPLTRHAKLLRYGRTVVVLWSVTALALYALRLHGLDAASVGIRPPHEPAQLLLGLVSLLAPLLATLAGAPRSLRPDYVVALRAVVPTDRAQWSCFFVVAASASLCEEFLYRGYALVLIADLTGSVVMGVLTSTLAFGFAHAYQGKAGIVGATVSGLLYAAVFLVTGSLYPCIIGHFVQDIAGAAVLSRRIAAPDPQKVAPPNEHTVGSSQERPEN